jgi:hypothetical protein
VNDQTVLKAGSFRVSDYRRSMPVAVKLQSLWRSIAKGLLPDPREVEIDCRELEFDHAPALMYRDLDLITQDFLPPQNDPEFIDARVGGDHDQKTFGRKAGAERTVTTRGSDIGEAAHIRSVSDTEAVHAAKLASKRGDHKEAARLLSTVKLKRNKRPKRKIPSRGFDDQHRPMRSRSYG